MTKIARIHDDLEPLVLRRELAQQAYGTIRGCVINHDDFIIIPGQSSHHSMHPVDEFLDVVLLVITA